MTEVKKQHYFELGIEFCLELAIGLYQLGAEQMDLPHNFGLGLFLWLVATALAVRMFWIFPKIERLHWGIKLLVVSAGIALLTFFAWAPVTTAYEKARVKGTSAVLQASAQTVPPRETAPPAVEEKKNKYTTGKTAGKHKKTDTATPTVIQNAPGGINIGGDNNGTAIINNAPPSRVLSDERAKQLTADFSQIALVKNMITAFLFPAGTSDDVEGLFRQLCNVMKDASWLPNCQGEDFRVTRITVPLVKGIQCFSRSWDVEPFASVKTAIDKSGLVCDYINGRYKTNGAEFGGLIVVIGTNPQP